MTTAVKQHMCCMVMHYIQDLLTVLLYQSTMVFEFSNSICAAW
jgi:hypothetical protein